MVSYQYTYLIGDLILLALWLVLFFYRKDTRKEMLVISLIFGIIGPFVELVHVLDWWKPLTITGTLIGIEDFLFGFGIGGVASVVYEHLFNKRVKVKRAKELREEKRNINLLFLILLSLAIFFGGFFIGLNSFVGTTLAWIIPTLITYSKRPDLIKNSLLSGISLLILSILGYHILNFITPGFFDEFWLFQNIGRIIILGIPLEEHVWFFTFGAFIGPLYEYWQEGKLINTNK
ncbi:MAG: lycopene cyclase domain-containing protein [Nanoarchaeota archaeon]